MDTHVDRQCPPLPHYLPKQCRGSATLFPHWRTGHGIPVNLPIPNGQIWANVDTHPLSGSCGLMALSRYQNEQEIVFWTNAFFSKRLFLQHLQVIMRSIQDLPPWLSAFITSLILVRFWCFNFSVVQNWMLSRFLTSIYVRTAAHARIGPETVTMATNIIKYSRF